jgi:hypothetical protein
MALSLSALMAPAPVLDVAWMDLAGVGALAQEVARREAAAVLKGVGLAPRWRTARAHDLIGPRELTVVLLPRDHAARGRPRRVLGACLPGSGTARVWVYLDAMAWALGLPPPTGTQTPEQAFRLGRAIGRVVAHEFIHAVAPAVPHARDGIMAASLGRGELLAARATVDPATRRGVQVASRASAGAGF